MASLVVDIETASACDLADSGSWAYAEHPTTEILIIAYANADTQEPPKIWSKADLNADFLLPGVLGELLCAERLIAHNANFDIGFIRVAAERCGMPFTNTYLDTLGLSRYVNPELTKHKLNIIAEHYKLEEFHHHRACDDAEVLARIFFKMAEQLLSLDVKSFDEEDDGITIEDYDFTTEVYCNPRKSITILKSETISVDSENYIIRVDTAPLGTGDLYCKVTAYIPDDDFADGFRTEVVVIDTAIDIVKTA